MGLLDNKYVSSAVSALGSGMQLEAAKRYAEEAEQRKYAYLEQLQSGKLEHQSELQRVRQEEMNKRFEAGLAHKGKELEWRQEQGLLKLENDLLKQDRTDARSWAREDARDKREDQKALESSAKAALKDIGDNLSGPEADVAKSLVSKYRLRGDDPLENLGEIKSEAAGLVKRAREQVASEISGKPKTGGLLGFGAKPDLGGEDAASYEDRRIREIVSGALKGEKPKGVSIQPAEQKNTTLKSIPSELLVEARKVMAKKGREAVIKKLQEEGYDTSGL